MNLVWNIWKPKGMEEILHSPTIKARCFNAKTYRETLTYDEVKISHQGRVNQARILAIWLAGFMLGNAMCDYVEKHLIISNSNFFWWRKSSSTLGIKRCSDHVFYIVVYPTLWRQQNNASKLKPMHYTCIYSSAFPRLDVFVLKVMATWVRFFRI